MSKFDKWSRWQRRTVKARAALRGMAAALADTKAQIQPWKWERAAVEAQSLLDQLTQVLALLDDDSVRGWEHGNR